MKTQTKLNLRFLACVVAVGAVLGVGVHLVHGYQVKRNAIAFLHMADKAKEDAENARANADKAREEKNGKYKEYQAQEKAQRAKEMDYLGRYLGFAPRDVDAQARYGEALDDKAKQTESPKARMAAYLRLENVLRLLRLETNPDKIRERQICEWRICERQVETAKYFGKFNEALAHLDVLHKAAEGDWGRLAKLDRDMGFCEAANGNYVNAAEAYERAIGTVSEQIDNSKQLDAKQIEDHWNDYWNLAVLYRERLPKVKDADLKMEEMVKKGEEIAKKGQPAFRAYLTRARYYLQFEGKDPEKVNLAKADVLEAGKLAPNEPDVVLADAELKRIDSLKEACKVLLDGIQKHPDVGRLYFALVTLEALEDKTNEALEHARQGLKALRDKSDDNKDKSDLLHALADLLVQKGEVTEAEEVIARLDKLPRIPKPLLDYLRARILVRQSKWSEASKLLEDVRTKLSRMPGLEVQALLQLGQCHEQLGNPDQALLAYQRAHKIDPLSIPVRYRTGALFMTLFRTEDALAEFRNILTAKKIPDGMHILLARALIVLNSRLPQEKRDIDEIRRELALASKYTPDAGELPIMQAETILLEDGKQTDAARQVIEKARVAQPDELGLWLASAQLSDREKALQILELARARPKLADRVELRLAQLRYLTQTPSEVKTPEQLKTARENLRTTLSKMEKEAGKLAEPTDRSRLLNGLADAHMRLGDTSDAERLWQQVAEQQPNNLGVRLLLFDLAMARKSTEAMDRVLEELRGIEGVNGVYWRYAMASRLIQDVPPAEKEELSNASRRQLLEARKCLVEAASFRPSWPRISTLEAQIDELEGKVSAAIEKYQHALALGEQRPVIVRRTVQLLFEQKRFDEANQPVRKLLAQGNRATLLAAGLGKLAAENLLANPELPDNDERALEFARDSVSESSKSYQDQLWLGRVQWAAGKKTEAEKSKHDAETSFREAEKSLRNACDLAENVPETWITLVAFLVNTGKMRDAEQAIEKATKKLPADRAPAALAACYESIGDLKKAKEHYEAALRAAPEDVRLLRLVATFYLLHGQAGQAEPRLRAILTLKGKQFDNDVMWARRGLAGALASNPSSRKFEEALELIDANLEKNESSLADKHTKALLLATRISRRMEAIGMFETLARSSPLPAHEEFTLVTLYMAENNWQRAHDHMLILLSSPDGQNPNYGAYFARSLIKHGDLGQAEDQLEKLKKAMPNAPLTREIEARVLKAKDQDDEALAVVRDYAKSGKDVDLVRVGQFLELLGKNGRGRDRYIAEAEAMYRKHVKQSDKPERFLTLAAFLGRKHSIDEALSYCEEAQKSKAAPQAVAQVLSNVLREANADEKYRLRVEKWLKEMLAQAPQSVPLMICLADVYDLQERFADAEKVYWEALEKDPDNVMVLNNLAWLLAFSKDPPTQKQALAAINKAIGLVGQGPELLDTRGVVYYMIGRNDQALKDLQEVVARAPSPNHSFHLALALAEVDKKRAQEVLKDAQKSGFDMKLLHPLEKKEFGNRLEAELPMK